MVTFVYAKRSIPAFVVMLVAFFMSFGVSTTTNAQALACNKNIQLSLGSSCSDTLSIALFSATMPAAPGILWLELQDANGNPIDSTSFTPAHGPIVSTIGTYTVVVHLDSDGGTDYDNDNSCWSTLVVEFKLDLGLSLGAVCGDPNDSCNFNCVFIDSIFGDTTWTGKLGLNPNFIGINDSVPCINIDTTMIKFRDVISGEICTGLSIKREWYVPSPVLNSHSSSGASELVITTQRFNINKDSLSGVMSPLNKVQIACGTEHDPLSIFKYLISRKTNPLSQDSAKMVAYPTILAGNITASGSTIPALRSLDSTKIALMPGVAGSDKTHISCNLAVSYSDQTKIPICGKGVKWVRHWTVIDWCTQTDTSFRQIIDATGQGEITTDMKTDTFNLSTDPWFCSANLVMDLPTVNAVCSDDYWLTLSSASLGINKRFSSTSATMGVSGIPPGTHQLIVSIQDDCNNNTTDTIYVNVSDGVSPVAVAKEQVVVTLLSAGGDCAAKVRANSIDNNSYDACSNENVKLEVKRYNDHDSTYAAHVELKASDLTDEDSRGIAFGIVKVALRVWDDGDGNGIPGTSGDNFNIAWTNVRIEDKNTDVFAECGKTLIEVDCDAVMADLIELHKPTAGRAGCINEPVDVTGRIKSNGRDDLCGTGGVMVEYTVGSKVICSKTFWFMDMDTVNIDSTIFPDDIFNANCSDASFGDFDLSKLDLNCNLIGKSIEEEVFEFETGISCLKILRHFTLIDWCEHEANAQTFYKFVDSLGINVGYRTIDTSSTSTVVLDTVRNGIWKHTQVVKISGGTPPELTGCVNQDFSAGPNCDAVIVLTNSATFSAAGGICPTGNLEWNVTVDKDGDGVFETMASVIGTNSVEATLPDRWEVGTYRVRWEVSAICSSSDICFTNFSVADTKAPTPICIQTLSSAVMNEGKSITIWASDFIASPAVDPCSKTIEYSFSELTPDEKFKTITCADIPNGISEIFEFGIYAHDESGNVGSCIARIQIDDTADACEDIVSGNSVLVAGRLTTESGDDIESVKVGIQSAQINMNESEITNVSGDYAFSNVATLYDYILTSEKNDDYLNGVSTLDLVLIQKHVLGLETLPSAYKVIAADVNNDAKVSAIDLIELRKLILGVYTELPRNDSWRFVDANQTFKTPANPWPFVESLTIRTLNHNVNDMDFIGVKIGDVSGNAVANSIIAGGRSNNATLSFAALNQRVSKGETFTLSFTAKDNVYASGIQLSLEFNGVKLNGLSSNVIDLQSHEYVADDHSLALSWVNAGGIALDGDVFILSLTATANGSVSQMIQFGSAFASEVYTDDLETRNIQFSFEGETQNVVTSTFELFQNEPNPFNDNTSISFVIGEDGPATLSVFDVTGQMILEVSDNFNQGMNKITLNKSDLKTSGVLYYQLNFGGSIATKKMISVQ
ncbi:MAG: T9SS type A sorting domain-containing protein [Saprospiraceae bacterium]